MVDGHTLSIPAVSAAARFAAPVALTDSPAIREHALNSRRVIEDKVASQRSVYGVSTGFGGTGMLNHSSR